MECQHSLGLKRHILYTLGYTHTLGVKWRRYFCCWLSLAMVTDVSFLTNFGIHIKICYSVCANYTSPSIGYMTLIIRVEVPRCLQCDKHLGETWGVKRIVVDVILRQQTLMHTRNKHYTMFVAGALSVVVGVSYCNSEAWISRMSKECCVTETTPLNDVIETHPEA